MWYKDKVVVISGATGGIGQALAEQVALQGADVALFARREDALKKLCDRLSSDSCRCMYQVCDVSKQNDVKAAVARTMEFFGRVDVAVLSAGVLVPNPIQTFDASVITKSMEINFFGIVFFVEELLRVMKRQGYGVIAATSTLPDRRGVPGWGAYGASKAAVSWLMESLRAEGKERYNVDFVTIKPGSVLTAMIEGYHRQGAISAEKAAAYILRGVAKGKKVIQFPLGQVVPIRLTDLFPPGAYDAQDVELLKGDGYPEVSEE